MKDDITSLCYLPYILFPQGSVLVPSNDSLILTIMAIKWQTNYDIKSHVFLFKILTEVSVSVSKATFSSSIFTFVTKLLFSFRKLFDHKC